MKVLIADDHKIVRIGLSLIVKETLSNVSIAEAGDATQIFYQVKHKKFDLMLMDLKMPNTDSIEVMEQLLKDDPHLKVLIVSLNPENIYALRCLKAGAFGYVEKNTNEDNLKEAIQTVAAGRKYISKSVTSLVTEYLRDNQVNNPFATLSKKEMLVTEHLIHGLGNAEICNLLQLQSSTVATYKTRIFEKAHVKNVHELTRVATNYGLL